MQPSHPSFSFTVDDPCLSVAYDVSDNDWREGNWSLNSRGPGGTLRTALVATSNTTTTNSLRPAPDASTGLEWSHYAASLRVAAAAGSTRRRRPLSPADTRLRERIDALQVLTAEGDRLARENAELVASLAARRLSPPRRRCCSTTRTT